MISRATDCSEDEERLLAAVVLLHSTDTDSAEGLRKMLEDAVERRLARTVVCQKPRGGAGRSLLLRKDNVADKLRRSAANKAAEEKKEDALEKEDIPRISIPDEGSSDGAFCKVCNGTKLGPMILLECQDCQEAYHPLCHCPPVIDIDVYDPRLVWRCSECIIHDTAAQPIDQYVRRNVNIAAKGSPERYRTVAIHGQLVAENSGVSPCKYSGASVDSGKCFRLRATHSLGRRAQSLQPRKRIGSKRSINRRNAKHTCT